MRLLTGRKTSNLKSPSSEQVETLMMKDLWSPGLSANNSSPNCTISISGDLYPPLIGDKPDMCVYGGVGPQHLWVNSSSSVCSLFNRW